MKIDRELDAQCNALFRKLEEMKKSGLDKNDNQEYMQTLYTLRDLTRERTNVLC